MIKYFFYKRKKNMKGIKEMHDLGIKKTKWYKKNHKCFY